MNKSTKTDPIEERSHPFGRLAKLGSQSAIALSGNAFVLFAGLPFQIYVAQQIGMTQLGFYGLVEASAAMMCGALSFGIAPLAIRFIPQYLEDKDYASIKHLLFISTTSLTAIGFLACVIANALLLFLPIVHNIPRNVYQTAQVMSLYIPATMMTFLFVQALRGFQRIVSVVLISVVGSLVIKIIASIYLFEFIGATSVEYAIAVVSSIIIPLPILAFAVLKNLPDKNDIVLAGEETDRTRSSHYKKWRSFALTIYGTRLAATFFGNVDRILVATFMSPALVGVLMVAKQIVVIPLTLQQVMREVISPMFAELTNPQKRNELGVLFRTATDWAFRWTSPMLIALITVPELILSIYGAEFAREGVILLIVLCSGAALNVALGPIGALVNMTGHHVAMLKVEIASKLLLAPLYFILIPSLGVVGAGIMFILIDLVLKVGAFRISRKNLSIQWANAQYLHWVFPCIFASVCSILTKFTMTYLRVDSSVAELFVLIFISYAAFVGATISSGGLSEAEAEVARSFMRRFRRVEKWCHYNIKSTNGNTE